jgi:hypothetical protein
MARITVVNLKNLNRRQLERMRDAGGEIREWYRVLEKTGDNVVGEVLRDQGKFYEWNHYPEGDIYDHVTHSQYYYHAHPADLRGGEHGHFHTFLRPKGMPPGIEPAPIPDLVLPEDEDDILSHLSGISMDPAGYPIRLFTTNRWVTGEIWYAAQDVVRMVDCFIIDHTRPSWPVNRWITAMLCLFQPQIVELVQERDRVVAGYQALHAGVDVYEDRDLEITSSMDISVDDQIAAVEKALATGS